jgi:hypothetical protein
MFARRRDVLERGRSASVASPSRATSRTRTISSVVDLIERFGGVDVLVLNSVDRRAPKRSTPGEQVESAARRSCSRRSGSSVSAAPTSRRAAMGA